jgi:hypothetical protein
MKGTNLKNIKRTAISGLVMQFGLTYSLIAYFCSYILFMWELNQYILVRMGN